METSPAPLLSSFRSLNEQRPTVPKEGSASLEHLLRKQNEFVYKLTTFIFSKIFLDILQCRLRQGEPKPQGGRLLMETSPNPLLSSFRSLNEQRPTVPKEGSTNL